MMKIMFLALFLLLISSAQAISAKGFNTIQSNGQAHELLGKLYGNGGTENSTRLNHKDAFVSSENEHKREISVAIRKGGGGGGGGREGGGSRGGGKGGGKARAGAGMRGGHHHNAASTIFPETHFWVQKFTLYFSLALTTLFLIY